MKPHILNTRIPPLLLVLISGFLMWLLHLSLPRLWLPDAYADLAGGVALASLLAGGLLALLGVVEFRRAQTTVDPRQPGRSQALVSSGVYRFSRNPMYVGFALCLLAWACYLEQAYALLVLAAFIAYMNRFQIEPEEQMLARLFADEFSRYRQQTPRWIRLPFSHHRL